MPTPLNSVMWQRELLPSFRCVMRGSNASTATSRNVQILSCNRGIARIFSRAPRQAHYGLVLNWETTQLPGSGSQDMIGHPGSVYVFYFVLILFHYRHKLYHCHCFDTEIHGYWNRKKSADPGLSQGRGGAWDHRRCGTSPSSLSTAKPILQPSSHINSFLPSPDISLALPLLCCVELISACLSLLLSVPQSCSQQAPQGHTSKTSYGRPSLPFASPKTLQTLQTLQTLKTLKTLQTNPSCSHQATSIASCLPPTSPSHCPCSAAWSSFLPACLFFFLFRSLAASRHPKATHQKLLMGAQVCRLPALKRSKRSKPSKPLKPLKPSKPTHLAAIKPHQ